MPDATDDRRPFRLYRPQYRDRDGNPRRSARLYVEFRDHTGKRQRWPLFKKEVLSERWAGRIVKLAGLRRNGDDPDERLVKKLEAAPRDLLDRLMAAGIVDAAQLNRGEPIAVYLVGRRDDAGAVVVGGYEQYLAAKRNTPAHVRQTVTRIRRVLDGCGLLFWRDLTQSDATGRIEAFLGSMTDTRGGREPRAVTPQTINYHVTALKGFGRWMLRTKRATNDPLAALSRVTADAEADDFRTLSPAEIGQLVAHVEAAAVAHGLTGPERAVLYRFAFESGFRPLTVRGLKVASFDLDADPPTVTAKAATMKRRKVHEQALRPDTAAELRGLFAGRMPDAAAFRMPSKYNLADMIRGDAAAARTAWIGEAAGDLDLIIARWRTDFLADQDRAGRRLGFYSLRHSHGTALADAGVPQKDIAGSLHHTKTATTDRYVRSGIEARARAVAALPDVRPPAKPQDGRVAG